MDNDEMVLEDGRDAAFELDKLYRRAIRTNDIEKAMELKPHVEKAYDSYGMARLNLLAEGVITTDDDVAQMRRIKAAIDQAATYQQIIEGAIEFAAFMARFAAKI